MAEASRHRSDRSKNLVGFVVGQVRYAVDILRVREIINPLPLVELPHAPPAVVGVADHRGSVVPIVDLRRRFGLPPAPLTRRTKWVIVDVEPGQSLAALAGGSSLPAAASVPAGTESEFPPSSAPRPSTRSSRRSQRARSVGLVVDEVTDVFGAGPAHQRNVPQLGLGDAARGIVAAFKYDEFLVFVLDIDRVAAPAEALDMSALGELLAEPRPHEGGLP